jgi:hypothetical protein
MESDRSPDLERARAFIERAEWTFAETMADTPHEYVARKKWVAAGGCKEEFFWFVTHIREAGWNGRWRHLRNR